MLKPLNDHLVVERLVEDSISKGGIIIPDTAKEKPTRARVMAVGSGKRDKNGSRLVPEVKPGDIVLFGKYSGSEVKLNGQEYVILREDDVLAVIEE
ncbi:MAG: co-chaperone GroES [Proteobacteria bacterium]|nr:co-chaperone GroES [Pseudomonadota bacterium]